MQFATQPKLAVEFSQEISQQKTVPFKYEAADPIDGNSLEFIKAIEDIAGIRYWYLCRPMRCAG
jgi:hypothetical protein